MLKLIAAVLIFSSLSVRADELQYMQSTILNQISDCSMFYVLHNDEEISKECDLLIYKALSLGVGMDHIRQVVEEGQCLAERNCTAKTEESVGAILKTNQ